ncbi:hypothetical protein DL546_007573 [Coniochaeta pulveracea]|uniref:Uncharacterized protein n=1 Tax=Coniochaeta pulveracea TaxID=177199 RepID=A0A420YKH8_9PEZI|nr:hypothetical protein DL546_007573 [Coniochaeta pulveracea]
MSSSSISDRRPSVFLSLAPATSNSYPQGQNSKSRQSSTESTAAPPLTTDLLIEAQSTPVAKRRASSISSDGSKSGVRILKLGPIHDGEHLDGQKGDWHEAVIE